MGKFQKWSPPTTTTTRTTTSVPRSDGFAADKKILAGGRKISLVRKRHELFLLQRMTEAEDKRQQKFPPPIFAFKA